MKKKKQEEKQKNNEFQEKIEDLKEELKEKTKEIKEDLKEKAEDIKEKTEDILNDIKDSSKKFDKKDIKENKAMACLAYVLPPIPYFIENKSKWVRYHSIQGMNLFIIFIILSLIVSIINSLLLFNFIYLKTILRTVLNVFGAIYSIVGIINVCNNEAKELPLINKLKLIKK